MLVEAMAQFFYLKLTFLWEGVAEISQYYFFSVWNDVVEDKAYSIRYPVQYPVRQVGDRFQY